MKKLLTIILLLASIPVYAHLQQRVSVSSGFLKGKDYLDFTTEEKRAYAMGVMNGMLVAPLLGAPEEKVAWLEKCTTEMTDEQIAAIITKYLNDHPGDWHRQMNVLSLNAMIATCPHPKTP
jgi:hypothetical protein